MRDLFWFFLIVASAFVGGHLLVRPWLWRLLRPSSYAWIATSAGLVAATYMVFLLGVFHCFVFGAVLVILGVLWSYSAFRIGKDPHIRRELTELLSSISTGLLGGMRESPLLGGLLAAFAGWAFLACGAPEVRGDPIIYHITEAWLFVVNKGHVEIPSSALTYIPQNQQLLYALGLLLGSDSLAKLFHWLQGILLISGTIVLARQFSLSRPASVAAALLVASCPMWFYLATTTYIDLAVGNYVLAGVVLLLIDVYRKEPVTATSRFSLVGWSGVFMGTALGCKYTAGLVGFLPGLVVYLFCLRRVRRESLTGLAARGWIYCMFAFLLFLPWLLRNYVWTGNPVAPSFLRVLGPHGVPESTLRWPDILAAPAEPIRGVSGLLLAYVKMFLSLSDFGNYLASLALLLGCTVLPLKLTRRATLPLGNASALSFLVLFLALAFLIGVPTAALRRDSRYIMAHVGVLAVLIVRFYDDILRLLPVRRLLLDRVARVILGVLVVSGATQNVLRHRDLNEVMRPIFSQRKRDEYCAARLMHYHANKALGKLISPEDGKVLGAAYPAHVHYVLGGAPMTLDLLVQEVRSIRPEHLPALRRQGIRFLFGEVAEDLLPYIELKAKCEGLPLWEIREEGKTNAP